MQSVAQKIFAQNKIAFKNYEIVEKFEAGIILKGFEVKAIRSGKVNLKGSYATIKGKYVILTNTHISPFQSANTPDNYEPTRPRNLLLKSREIRKIQSKLQPSKNKKDKKKESKNQGKYTLIPLKIYDSKGLIKIELGLGRGLKKFDKRDAMKKKEANRIIRNTR